MGCSQVYFAYYQRASDAGSCERLVEISGAPVHVYVHFTSICFSRIQSLFASSPLFSVFRDFLSSVHLFDGDRFGIRLRNAVDWSHTQYLQVLPKFVLDGGLRESYLLCSLFYHTRRDYHHTRNFPQQAPYQVQQPAKIPIPQHQQLLRVCTIDYTYVHYPLACKYLDTACCQVGI